MAQPAPQRIAQPAVQAAEVIAIDTDEEQFVMSDGDAESPEELDEFFTAAKEHEQQEYEPMTARSYALDIEMHFCTEAAMWDGEFFNVAPFKEPAAFGDATDGATMDIDALLKKSFA